MEKITYSIPEVATALGISKPTAYTLANSEGFPIVKIGKRKVVPVQGLRDWVAKNTGVQQE